MHLRTLLKAAPRRVRQRPVSTVPCSNATSTGSDMFKYPFKTVGVSFKSLAKPKEVTNEDAFFIQSNGSTFGVFDGVGSWSFEGKFRHPDGSVISAGDFSHTLSKASATAADKSPTETPANILQTAWDHMCKKTIPGSSSATIVRLEHDRNAEAPFVLHCAQLGDCAFFVYSSKRKYEMSHRSEPMLHWFNCPFQLGITAPPELKTDQFDSPAAARIESVQLDVGDLVLLASDGLYSNVFEDQIASIVQEHALAALSDGSDARWDEALHAICSSLSQTAMSLSINKMVDSPFAVAAKDNNIVWSKGGRPDDCTVVVARVCEPRPTT